MAHDPFGKTNHDLRMRVRRWRLNKTDKLGRPINIQRFGSLDLTKLYSRVDKQAHFKSILVNCEVLTREILPACTYKKLLNHHQSSGSGGAGDVIPVEYPPDFLKITNAFCIVDLKGFSLTQFWQVSSLSVGLFILNMWESHSDFFCTLRRSWNSNPISIDQKHRAYVFQHISRLLSWNVSWRFFCSFCLTIFILADTCHTHWVVWDTSPSSTLRNRLPPFSKPSSRGYRRTPSPKSTSWVMTIKPHY